MKKLFKNLGVLLGLVSALAFAAPSWAGVISSLGAASVRGFGYSKVAGGGTLGGTWDPSKKSSRLDLSGGNLTVTVNTQGWSRVLSQNGFSSGEYSFKETVTLADSFYPCVGFSGLTSINYDMYLGDTNYSIGFYADGSANYGGSPDGGWGGTYTSGDVIETVYNANTGNVYIKKNGVTQAGSVRTRNLGAGPIYAATCMFTVGGIATANFN